VRVPSAAAAREELRALERPGVRLEVREDPPPAAAAGEGGGGASASAARIPQADRLEPRALLARFLEAEVERAAAGGGSGVAPAVQRAAEEVLAEAATQVLRRWGCSSGSMGWGPPFLDTLSLDSSWTYSAAISASVS
jgi:hypothetical protein